MRLFAAVDPPPDVTAPLARAVEALGVGGDARVDALRWVPPEQWHVTVAFFGEVPDAVIPDLLERLGRVATRSSPMTLSLDGAGCFPRDPRAARVLWLGVAGDVDRLHRVADRCAAAGRRAGADVDRRRFHPHLTLARSRRAAGTDARRVLTWLAAHEPASWQADSVRLVRSTLGAHVVHDTVATWPLTAADERPDSVQ